MSDPVYDSFPTIAPIADINSYDRVYARSISPGSFQGAQKLSVGGSSGVNISGSEGIFAGASTFASSPFSVDLSGNLSAKNVTITDSNGTTIIDGVGLSSTNQFASGNLQGNFPFTNTSTTYAAVTSFSLSLTLTRSAKVFLYAMFNQSAGAGSVSLYDIYVDSSSVSTVVTNGGSSYNVTISTITTISSGSHTIQVYCKAGTVTGTQSANIANVPAEIGYIVLGK